MAGRCMAGLPFAVAVTALSGMTCATHQLTCHCKLQGALGLRRLQCTWPAAEPRQIAGNLQLKSAAAEQFNIQSMCEPCAACACLQNSSACTVSTCACSCNHHSSCCTHASAAISAPGLILQETLAMAMAATAILQFALSTWRAELGPHGSTQSWCWLHWVG
jgi:hypothetical protein